ncbi:MAG: SAF domain-containing protein [Nocardioidaceae bacterium]
MASTKTPTSRSNGGSGSGRLPSTRERRPALAALAVILILGGSLASAWLAVRSGHRAEFVQVATEVGKGQQIEDSDLETVELPEDFQDGIPADERDDIVGMRAATPWTEGMVVMDSMVTDESPVENGMLIMPVPVEASQVSELTAGAPVVIFTGSDTGVAGTLTADPEVASEDSDLDSSGPTVSVEVSATCGSEVAAAVGEDETAVAQDSAQTQGRTTC